MGFFKGLFGFLGAILMFLGSFGNNSNSDFEDNDHDSDHSGDFFGDSDGGDSD